MKRVVTLVLFVLAAAAGGLGDDVQAATRTLGAVGGVAVGVATFLLWREGVRPAPRPTWWILGTAAALAALFFPPWVAVGLLALAATWTVATDHSGAPSAVLALATAAVLWRGLGTWTDMGQAQAWWVAGGALAAVSAAMWERDRLAARHAPAVGAAWQMARVAVLAAWTTMVVLLREALPWAAPFRAVGIDVARASGRLLLATILLAALALAAWAWSRRRDAPG